MFKLINKTETGENYMININEVLMQNKIARVGTFVCYIFRCA